MALEDFIYGLDLLYYVLKSGGQSASTTDDYVADAKAAIRKEYWQILCMEPWNFALAATPGVITTVASQNVTVLSIAGATVTLSANIAATQAGRKFYLNSNQAFYRISAHTAGTATLTLDATYVEDETAGPAVIFQDEYALSSSCMRLWGPLNLRGQFEGEIDLMGAKEFKAEYGDSRVSGIGITEAATEIRQDSSGNPQIQIAPWSEDRINIEYDYTEFHNLDFTGAGSGDTPKLRREDRWIIGERALWTLFRNKDDQIADSAWKRSEEGLMGLRDKHLPKGRKRLWARSGNSLSG